MCQLLIDITLTRQGRVLVEVKHMADNNHVTNCIPSIGRYIKPLLMCSKDNITDWTLVMIKDLVTDCQ